MILTWLSYGGAAVELVAAGYLGWLATLSLFPRAAYSLNKSLRCVAVVPAHNEAKQIQTTVHSLLSTDYPKDNLRVLVVADNCSDETAALAAAAGADVLTRTDDAKRGKGYALDFAFSHILAGGDTDAIVVIDADTVVSANLFAAFAARLQAGERAVQGNYGVRNPMASWRTRLMAVALGMFHRVRSIARERLGVSAGLRGNGMCFACELLRAYPHQAFGLVEDVEYGLTLGRAGIRVAYADEAQVLGEMVAGAQASESQRARWEGGRAQLVRQQLPGLAKLAVNRRSGLLFDLAMDLAVPPLSTVVTGLLLGCALEATRILWGGAALAGCTLLWAVNILCLMAYVGRGMMLSTLGWRALPTMLFAPVYIGWKILLRLKPGRKNSKWIRTQREGEHVS